MQTIPEVNEGSKWTIPFYGPVQVVSCKPRGKPPGRQVKFYTIADESDSGTLPLKKFLKAAKPL